MAGIFLFAVCLCALADPSKCSSSRGDIETFAGIARRKLASTSTVGRVRRRVRHGILRALLSRQYSLLLWRRGKERSAQVCEALRVTPLDSKIGRASCRDRV